MKKEPDFIEIINRIKEALNLKSDTALAEVLEMSQSTFAERKRRESIPYEEIIRLCDKMMLSMSWVFYGEGEPQKKEIPLAAREPQLDYICDLLRSHNNKILNNMIEAVLRIMDEGDYRKMAAVQSLIAALDPAEKNK